MKVIYAGFSKCGTKTMNAALTELGYNCYDYIENYMFLGDEWTKIFKEGGTTEDFRRMYENVDAVMDIPCCYFWEEIHNAFPDAKIIFSQRANDDIWWGSMEKQLNSGNIPILKLMKLLSPTYRAMDVYTARLCATVFGVDTSSPWYQTMTVNELLFRKTYRTHNAYLLEKAPKDKLHVINFDDGWEPLCKFLGVPVPNTPFPHKNKGGNLTKEFIKTNSFMLRMQREVMISGSLLVGLFGFGIYKLATRPSDSASLLSYVTSPVNALLEKLGYQ